MSIADHIDKFRKPGESARKELGKIFHCKREISYYLALPFLYLPLTPNQITILANLVQIAGIAVIAFSDSYERLVGIFLFLLGDLLDFVDGNIARYRSQTSELGVFLDQFGHVIVAPLFFCALGLAAYFDSNAHYFLYISILLTAAPIFVSYQLVAIHQYIPKEERSQQFLEEQKSGSPLRHFIRKTLSGLFHFKLELALAAILFDCIDILAMLFAAYFPIRIAFQFALDTRRIQANQAIE